MVRYQYNTQMEPAAPFVHVAISPPDRESAIGEMPAQLDTAADMTVLPAELIDRLGLVPVEEVQVLGLGGHIVQSPAYFVQLTLRTLPAVYVKALGCHDEPYILLGRDILNQFRLVLDGPRRLLEIEYR